MFGFWELFTTIILLTSPEAYEEMVWPQPTKEITALVELMGDDEFNVREKANRQLRDMGFKALLALRRGTKHNDLEIRRRCERTLRNYLGVWPTKGDYESIFKMEFGKKIKTHDGKGTITISQEMAKSYYLKQWEKDRPVEVVYYNEDVAKRAALLYAESLVRQGADKEALIKMIDSMKGREAKIPKSITVYSGP